MARRRPRTRWGLWLTLAALVFGVSFGSGLLAAPVDFAAPTPPSSALLVDDKGRVVAELRSPEQRIDVKYTDLPPVMIRALLAAEDRRFLTHSGVDLRSVLRAAVADLRGGHQGGSTLTQQYVKNVYTGNAHTVLRKLREAALAVRLEQQLTKQEILTRYLNEIYLGNGCTGIEAASRYYFGVSVGKLTLPQAAMLAGIIPAPSDYNPVHDMAAARHQQLRVLNAMVAVGDITPGQASAAYRTAPTITAQSLPALPTVAPEFRDLVAARLRVRYASHPDTVYTAGLRVTTTLDLDLQQAAVAALAQTLPSPGDPEAAVVVVDYKTGDIKALTTRRDGGYTTGGFDEAVLAQRTSGSTIKPFTLARALADGQSLGTFRYGPAVYRYPAGCAANGATIMNDEGGGGGYTLRSALASSVNTVYGPLAVDLGPARVAALAEAAGLGDLHGHVGRQCSMGLGVTVTPLNEARAYATLADGGVRHDVRSITAINTGAHGGSTGTRVYTAAAPAGTPVIPAPVAADVVTAMRDVVAVGTGTAAQQPPGVDVFGKTGTTDNFTDAWFTGCLPAYTVCVSTWMGFERPYLANGAPHSLNGVEGVPKFFGGTLPAQLFARLFTDYRQRLAPSPTPAPSSGSPTPVAVPTPTPVAPAPPTVAAPAPGTTPPTAARSATPAATPTRRRPTPTPTPTRSAPPSSPPPIPIGPSSPAPSPSPTATGARP